MKNKINQALNLSVLILLIFLNTSCFGQDSTKIERITFEIEKVMKTENIPAISVGIILNGKDKYFINKGTFDRKQEREINEKSIFQIGSVSKLLTGIVINDLIQKEKIDINESILNYLSNTYTKKTKSKLKDITIGDLLHHRSGFRHQSKVIKRKDGEPIIYDYQEADFEKDFKKMKLKSKESFKYSNFGYSVLGHISERVTNTTFEELLKKILKEYRMESTSIYCKNPNALVTPYRKDKRKMETQNWKMGKLAPSGGIYSSVSDLTNLLLVQLKVYKEGNKEGNLFLTKNKRVAWDETGISYGFGLFDWGNGDFGHGGDMDGYGSEYWFNPKENVGFVLLTSSGGKWVSELGIKINKILKE